MLWFDHVIFGTSDMDGAARRWRDEFGLDSLAGGRHRRQGTGNRIVPLGPDYLDGDVELDVRVVTAGTRGVRAVGVRTPDGDLVIS